MSNNYQNCKRSNNDEADGEAFMRNLEQVVPADSQPCYPSSRPVNNTVFFQQPQDENNSEGYPQKFERQSSFRKESQNYSASQTVQPNHITDPVDLLNSYHSRVESFNGKWPDWATLSIFDIAKAGMRYIGPEDKVQCDYCRGILYSWDDGDVPLEEHQKHFPLCSFLQERCWEILDREIQQSSIYSQKVVDDNKKSDFSTVPTGYAQYQQINEPSWFNQTPEFVQPNSVTTCEDSSQNSTSNSESNVAIDICKSMGYDDEMIQKAVTILRKDVSNPELNSSNLLDILFTLEDSMDMINDSDEEINSLDEQLRRHANIEY